MKPLIDFTIEVLDGCIHDCFGCQVNKQAGRTITEEEVKGLMSFFQKQDDKRKAILEIGPTDFITSTNSQEVFERLVPLMDMFEMVQISSAMTYKTDRLEALLLPLVPYLKGRVIRLAVPLHPRNYHNDAFYQLIDNNVKLMLSLFEGSSINNIAFQFNIVPDVTKKDLYNVLLQNQSKLIKDIDVVLQGGRKDLKDLNNQMNFKKSLLTLRTLHEEFELKEQSEFNPLSTLYVEDMLQGYTNAVGKTGKVVRQPAIALFYHEGVLYKPFSYGEKIAVLDEAFGIPFDADNINLIEELNSKMLAQQMVLMDEECSDCRFSNLCLDNNNIMMKFKYGKGECILPKEKMESAYHLIPIEPDCIVKPNDTTYYIDRFNPEKMS